MAMLQTDAKHVAPEGVSLVVIDTNENKRMPTTEAPTSFFFIVMGFFYISFLLSKFGFAITLIVIGNYYKKYACDADITTWMVSYGCINLVGCAIIFVDWKTRHHTKTERASKNKANYLPLCQSLISVAFLVWGTVVVFRVYGTHGWTGVICPHLVYHFAFVYLIISWIFILLVCFRISPYTL